MDGGDHATIVDGVWIKVAKKGSGIPSVHPPEALDVALCFGWIDGQRKSIDETFYQQKYTPRRARSKWSKINVEKVAALTEAGLMRPAGVAEVERARADGRWDAATSSPGRDPGAGGLPAGPSSTPGPQRRRPRAAELDQPVRDPLSTP